MAIAFFMGMQGQLNLKTYWASLESLFHCKVISNLLTRSHFLALTRCLYIINLKEYVQDLEYLEFDKMHQTHLLLQSITSSSQSIWNLGKYVTVDKIMVCYKGSYCPAIQYMPKKLEKWDLKLQCLAYSTSKFVYNFIGLSGLTCRSLFVSASHQNFLRILMDVNGEWTMNGRNLKCKVLNDYFS